MLRISSGVHPKTSPEGSRKSHSLEIECWLLAVELDAIAHGRKEKVCKADAQPNVIRLVGFIPHLREGSYHQMETT